MLYECHKYFFLSFCKVKAEFGNLDLIFFLSHSDDPESKLGDIQESTPNFLHSGLTPISGVIESTSLVSDTKHISFVVFVTA